MADNSEKILDAEEDKWSHVSSSGTRAAACGAGRDPEDHLLFACGRKEPHHLHGQLKPLKVML